MGILNVPRIPRGSTLEDAINIFNMAMEETEHRVNGFLQSSNIQEIGGYLVNKTELKHKDGDVGLSSEDTGGDDVRLWAGSTDKNTAPWRITKSGKEHSTGATIESSSGYPKYVLDPSTGKISAYYSADTYLEIVPNYNGTSPVINFWNSGANKGQLIVGASGDLEVSGSSALMLKSGGDITLQPGQISGNKVKVGSFNTLQDSGGTGLQDALNTKATAGSNTGSAGGVTLNGGIPINTVLATAGGGSVTWAGITVPNHVHTQSL